MQKAGAGLHTASSCFWDNTTDGMPPFNTIHFIEKISSNCYSRHFQEAVR